MATSTTGASIAVCVTMTVLYTILKMVLGVKYKDPTAPKRLNILLGIYAIGFFISLYTLNLQASKSLCGSAQTGPVFIVSLLAFLLMFGILPLIFSFMPGWKAPFSNTLGYIAASIGGVGGIFQSMIATGPSAGNPMLQKIKDNKAIMINEITPKNFETFMKGLKKNKLIGDGAKKYYGKLYKLVALKDSIAEMVWYILVGILAIFTSSQAILELSCTKTPASMLAQQEKWHASQDASGNALDDDKDTKVYSIRE